MSSFNLYIYNTNPSTKAKEKSEYKAWKSQKTRMPVVRWCLLNITGKLQPWKLNMKLDYQDLHSNKSWHASVVGAVLFWIKSFLTTSLYVWKLFLHFEEQFGRNWKVWLCWVSLGIVFEVSKASLLPQRALWLLVVQEEVSSTAVVSSYFCLAIMDFWTI